MYCISSNKYLSNIEGIESIYFGVATKRSWNVCNFVLINRVQLSWLFYMNENSVFLVGGSRSNQVQSINFEGVTDLTEAKQKQWVMLGSLTYDVLYAGVQFYNKKLFVLSSSNSSYFGSVQSFDLLNNKTKISGV